MRKKNFLRIIFVKPSVGATFFRGFYSYGKVQPPKTAFSVFALLLCLHILHLCRDRLFVVSGKGSSGLLRTKKVGAASRLDDNLHASISLQVVFSP
ncbi:glycine cleavage system H protein [Prevotella dentalis DSM 3688]|uniref:Glycine cleavage system H protein n=1 Tax=Prevotella dentalis (strain ATCC 49559 / DSM 3688 / JCM 13448 / NCTC 12043 / ES 2772) TaxID=908937 RepID=F9D6G2_PREDD|nr:glycine cleavage system H protein [Prevotella dentalis DSM 3688]